MYMSSLQQIISLLNDHHHSHGVFIWDKPKEMPQRLPWSVIVATLGHFQWLPWQRKLLTCTLHPSAVQNLY